MQSRARLYNVRELEIEYLIKLVKSHCEGRWRDLFVGTLSSAGQSRAPVNKTEVEAENESFFFSALDFDVFRV